MAEASSPRHHPGYLLAHTFELEIALDEREDTEKIIFVINNFNLPEIASRTFDVYWGPGYPAMRYPGPLEFSELNLDITNFYEKRIISFLLDWFEHSIIHIIPNLRVGTIIGYDDDRVPRFKLDCYQIWPTRLSLGEMSRDTNRQRVSCTLFVRDFIFDCDYNLYEFDERCAK